MDSSIHKAMKFDEELLNLLKEEESCERVLEILQGFCFYNSTDESGKTLLHYSVQYNNASLTQNLVDKGCNVTIQDNMGNTPLMIAMMQKHDKIIEILIAAGSDIFQLNNEKKSALCILSELHMINSCTLKLIFQELQKKCSSKEQIVKNLIDAGCHLYQAAVMEDSKIIESMLEQGISVDCAHPHEKITALHQAVDLIDLESVNVLVRYGANVNALNRFDENPLCNVYKNNSEHNLKKKKILRVLLNQGCLMTSCICNGIFQASYLLHRGNHNMIQLILEFGIDFNVHDNQTNKTVLHYLASNRNPGVIHELKPYVDKFNVNVVDKFGMNPLFVAVIEGNVDMVKFFLNQGGEVNLRCGVYNTTPLYHAYRHLRPALIHEYDECGELLLQYNADPQFIVPRESGEPETVFDIALIDKESKRIEPVVAHLAVLEKRGTLITERTKTLIDLDESLKEYFGKCRRVIAEPVGGGRVLFDLLISDVKKMAQYLGNYEYYDIMETLKEDSHFSYQMNKHRYYYNVLERRCFKGKRYKKLKIKASMVIRKFFLNRIHKSNLVIDKIIEYLNVKSLKQLSLLYYQQLSYRRHNFTTRSKKL